jgi:hypothetical protein
LTRFVRYTLIAIVALFGPKWLMSDACASFRAVAIDDSDVGIVESSSASTSSTENQSPNEPVPVVHLLRVGFDMPANSGAGSAGSSSSTFPPGALSGIHSELPSIAPTIVTRLRVAEERVAVIPPPKSVFEPPRAG